MLIFITEKKLLIFCGAKPCGDRLTDDLVSTGQVAMGSNRAGTGGAVCERRPCLIDNEQISDYNISVIITIKTYGRRNRIAQRWRNWFGAARQSLPRRQVPSSQAG